MGNAEIEGGKIRARRTKEQGNGKWEIGKYEKFGRFERFER